MLIVVNFREWRSLYLKEHFPEDPPHLVKNSTLLPPSLFARWKECYRKACTKRNGKLFLYTFANCNS